MACHLIRSPEFRINFVFFLDSIMPCRQVILGFMYRSCLHQIWWMLSLFYDTSIASLLYDIQRIFFTTLYYIVHCTFWNSYCKSFTFQLSLFGICISQILCIKIRNLDSWPVFGFCHYILEQYLLFRTVAGVKTLGWLLLH